MSPVGLVVSESKAWSLLEKHIRRFDLMQPSATKNPNNQANSSLIDSTRSKHFGTSFTATPTASLAILVPKQTNRSPGVRRVTFAPHIRRIYSH